MAKLIVFEGISGSGKSHLIDAIVSINKQCETVKWFDNELTINLLSGIHNEIPVSHDFFSTCYAIDFYGKYKYKIEPELMKKDLILHRYIYTPLTHDFVRGTSYQLLHKLYGSNRIKEPDLIVYMDTPPEEAYERIIRTRRPSFYECGLDCFLWQNLEQAKKDYDNDLFAMDMLKSYYLEFQRQIQSGYNAIFHNKNNVLRVDYMTDIREYVEYVTDFIQK